MGNILGLLLIIIPLLSLSYFLDRWRGVLIALGVLIGMVCMILGVVLLRS